MQKFTIKNIRENIIGIDAEVPTINGMKKYINFDNGASAPSLGCVKDKVDNILTYYSNVERGMGFKSQICTWAFEEAREIMAEFLNADPEKNLAIFSKNTTESINKLAQVLSSVCNREDPVIITTLMEHHSNELPWRFCAEVVRINVKEDGRLDLEDCKAKIQKYKDRLELVAITGAANVTGYLNPVHKIARWAHEAGAKIHVDAAQLAPHRPIDMKPNDHPEHLDFVSFCGHKMYAPYGVGVLVGDRATFEAAEPCYVGGGTVKKVTQEEVVWADPPERQEAGTPDIIGCIAIAAAAKVLNQVGWDDIIAHEKELTRHALKRIKEIPNVILYGSDDPEALDDRLGVITFNLKDIPHKLVATILSYEGAIGIRSGGFCAHPYILQLLEIPEDSELIENIQKCSDSDLGAVRASFGMYNTIEEIDEFIEILKIINDGTYSGEYIYDKSISKYVPKNFEFDFEKYFTF